MAYSDKVIDHYSNPRNVGQMDKASDEVGTGLVGAPECGDVMRLQIRVNPETQVIEDAKFKTFGCGSAIASSSLATEWVKGKTISEALDDLKHRYCQGTCASASQDSLFSAGGRCDPRGYRRLEEEESCGGRRGSGSSRSLISADGLPVQGGRSFTPKVGAGWKCFSTSAQPQKEPMSTTLLQPGTTAPRPGASAPADPLAGQTVLDAEGQAGQKGIQVTPRALKRIRVAMAKENITPDAGGLRVRHSGRRLFGAEL